MALVPIGYWASTAFMTSRVEKATKQIEASAHAAFNRLQEKQRRRAHEQREQAALVRQHEVAAHRAATEAELRQREAERLKELAWSRFFVAPAACEKPPTWEFQVECGNRYMRAKREFDAKWNRGEIGIDALGENNPRLAEEG
jgi:hypothetical protein